MEAIPQQYAKILSPQIRFYHTTERKSTAEKHLDEHRDYAASNCVKNPCDHFKLVFDNGKSHQIA